MSLTETVGHPTPTETPFLADRQLAHGDMPLPATPGRWRLRQSVEYSQTASRAVLDYASRNREHLLFSIWRMGVNSTKHGSRDSRAVLPSWIDRVAEEVNERGHPDDPVPGATRTDYDRLPHDPAQRDAHGYRAPEQRTPQPRRGSGAPSRAL